MNYVRKGESTMKFTDMIKRTAALSGVVMVATRTLRGAVFVCIFVHFAILTIRGNHAIITV